MTEVNTSIRKAQPNDSTSAVEIVFPILRAYGIEPDPDRLDADIVAFGNNSNDIKDFVAEIEGQVMGVLTILVEDSSRFKITGLYVSPEARRKGLGRSLLQHAVDLAKESGYSKIHLETRTIFKEAVNLYESTGWERGPDLPEGYGPDRTYFLDLNVDE